MSKARTSYTTLDDLWNRLENAVDTGQLSEQEAWDEFQEIAREERAEEREREAWEREMEAWLEEELKSWDV